MKKMNPIPEVQKSVRMTTTFSGYNHQEIISDGEMYETLNMTGENAPMLTPRRRRGISSFDVEGQDPVILSGIHGRDQLVYIRGQEVFYNFVKVEGLQVSDDEGMLPKKIVSMGAYTCIWPDKVYFNTVDLSDCGSMENMHTASGDNVQAIMCRGDGTDYDLSAIPMSVEPPQDPTNGDFWMDQSGDVDVLRQYAVGTLEWVEVPSVYVKISATGIGHGFSEYDAVDIMGLTAVPDTDPRIAAQIEGLNGSHIVYGAGENYIIVVGLLSRVVSEFAEQEVSIRRAVPDLDYICESNNRLWGCKYGLENGVVVNEIRASKLGDFRNWSCFMGLSTDSYTASIGTDGQFTGAISQRGYPVFFKENAIHRISGNTPSTFSVQTTNARGVQAGSWRSLAIVNENVYYKARDAIMMYDGNMPQSVSEQMGRKLYQNARAGAVGNTYYISMRDSNNEWSLFTYITDKGIWYREDATCARGFGCVEDELFYIDERANTLVAVRGSVGAVEEELRWMAEFGISGVEYTPSNYGKARADYKDHHYMSRFDIRMYLEEGHQAHLEIMYDSSGEWTDQGTIRGRRMRTFMLPVIPRRCDHLRFRISGDGDMRIYSIARIIEVGADG